MHVRGYDIWESCGIVSECMYACVILGFRDRRLINTHVHNRTFIHSYSHTHTLILIHSYSYTHTITPSKHSVYHSLQRWNTLLTELRQQLETSIESPLRYKYTAWRYHECICTYIQTYMHTNYIHTYIHNTHPYLHTYTHIHTCIHTYTYILTYIHTHTYIDR